MKTVTTANKADQPTSLRSAADLERSAKKYMCGYHKLISKDRDHAVVEIAGWDSLGIVLHPERIKSLKADVERIQQFVHGEGHQATHLLWEELNGLLALSNQQK
jgi:tyrosine-protein phosphatase YwqE